MKKHFLALGAFLLTLGQVAWASSSKPDAIQQGNILHCFNWPINDVKNALQSISDAGFGAVQLSPLQRADVNVGSPWHDLYRPYDLAFKSSGMGSESDLQSLCSEAEKYGIKVIVDVVANHVDKTAGYHDPWWDSNNRVRWEGGINYGDRRSITHGQLGDYGDVNSELSEVAARGKAYVQKLASLGVKGIRWDAAKHIGLPSEGCNFWKEVTSVPGVWHYGEILDAPGPNSSIIKEYGQYMSVTDNKYSNAAARDNGGIPGGHGGSWDVDYGLGDKVIYWAESHDTYANDEWSQHVDQAVIDRAYAAYACRNGAAALYLSRPNAKGFNNIKVGKGSTAFTAKHIAEVNKFRNAMIGKKDWFEKTGNACSVTRQNGGAVIVMKGSGNVSIANGGGYCPAGTYTDRVSGGTFTVTASTISGNVGSSGIAVIYNDGDNPNPNPGPDPNPNPGTLTITGDYNIAYSGDKENVHYWGGSSPSEWPGVKMTTAVGSDGKTYKVAKIDAKSSGCIFNTNGNQNQTGNLTYSGSYVMTDNGPSTTAVIFKSADDPTPAKPVVTASPASGTTFTGSITVTLSVNPAASIYYTLDGSEPNASSSKYSAPIKLTATTTVKAVGIATDGTKGNVASFKYTLKSDPTPPTPGENLITDYYKVNPNGQCGSQRTVNVSGHPATSALSNWKPEDLIAQGVARDVCMAFRGTHERPVVDSYALYAAYDNQNLYLGVQFVYTVWNIGGEGKQGKESKPYNMDGHMMIAFDLDPASSFDGYINGKGPIWNEDKKGAKFDNGVDAVLMCSTKPGVGTPGFFVPTPDGHASYDAAYCKTLPKDFYGYADGLLPSIDHIWGQAEFGYDPELLKGNEGFVDLKGEIEESAHTFYEFKIPLSLLGVTDDYIRTNGIGVMYLDKYGTSPVGGTPYDPSYFDDPFSPYSPEGSTSAEKEDEDVITYKPARVGKANSAVESIFTESADADAPVEYYNIQGMRVVNPAAGIYIMKQGNKVTKVNIR